MIEIPGCRDAWQSISEAAQISNLETLVKNDCAVLYRKGFRLPTDGGTSDPNVCEPAWNALINADKYKELEFMITHNCHVFYRKGWQKCQSQSEASVGQASLTAQAEKSTYTLNEPIVINYSGFPGNSQDWLAVVPVGTPDNKYQKNWFYTKGNTSGTHTFNGLPAGEYEVRGYFNWPDGGYTVQTRSQFQVESSASAQTQQAQTQQAQTQQASYDPDEAIIVEYSGLSGSLTDWITIVPAGAADKTYKEWFYPQGKTEGTHTFKGFPAGEYEVRGYFNWSEGDYTVQTRSSFTVREKTSGTFVGQANPTIQAEKSTYTLNEPIVINYSGFLGDSQDWVTVVPVGTPDNAYRHWFYTKGNTSGTHTFNELPAGEYEVRGYFKWPDGGYTVQTRSQFRIESNASAKIQQASYKPDEAIVVEYSGFSGSQTDWITIVPAGAADNTYKQWFYTLGNTNGTHTFKGLPAGEYEVRGYFNWLAGGYTVQTRSSFTVREKIKTIVNIDARTNTDADKAVIQPLPAGDYTVHVIGTSDGGQFDAWNRTNHNENCDASGANCKYGFEHRTSIRTPSFLQIERTGRYDTPELALQNAPTDVSFTLEEDSEVKFYVYDTINADNNQGGVSLLVTEN
ncbi:MAG: hypothetical protein F6K30_25315 [Cyanothece sp. SIO2G6]|nr:hypothetical protein [Cyanothece sp. SIO2G6]